MRDRDLSFPIASPSITFTHERLASMTVEELDAELQRRWGEYERQSEAVANMILVELLREPITRFMGQAENILNQHRHRRRQWGKWRRRQARKQNRRRN